MPLLKKDIELSNNQKNACKELIAEIKNARIKQGLIYLIGEFGSGKTTLIKYYLDKNFDNPEDYYIPINERLIEYLKNNENYEVLHLLRDTTKNLMIDYLKNILSEHFKKHSLLFLDNIELLLEYNVNLNSIIGGTAIDGKVCIVSLPKELSKHANLIIFGKVDLGIRY